MKKRTHGIKKIVGVLLAASMCVPLGITAFAMQELTPNEAEKKTLYVVNSESSKNREDERKATFGEQNVISETEVTDKIVKEYSNLVIEEEALDEEIQKTLREAFENETKIFVTGNITANAIREYFGLDTVEAVAEDVREVGETAKQEENDVRYVDVSLFPTVGRLIYQDWRGTNVTTVKSSNSEHWKDPTGLIEKCFNYDYLYNTTGVEKAKRRAGADTWSRVDVVTDTFECGDRCVVSTSIRLDKYDGNPDSRGNYYYYVPFIVDIENNATIQKVDVTTYGAPSSKIADYGPTATSVGAGASISFSLPKAISVSFTPGPRTKISKISGGIDNKAVTIRYQPRSMAGLDSYTQDDIRCDAHIESYQSGPLGAGYGAFEIHTYVTNAYGDTYVDPIVYTNSHPCTVN